MVEFNSEVGSNMNAVDLSAEEIKCLKTIGISVFDTSRTVAYLRGFIARKSSRMAKSNGYDNAVYRHNIYKNDQARLTFFAPPSNIFYFYYSANTY